MVLLLTFLCGFLFIFAYVTMVGMIASGFTEPAIPVWAREDILEWMFDVPQQTDPYVTQDGFSVFKGPKVPPNFAGSDQLGGHTPEYISHKLRFLWSCQGYFRAISRGFFVRGRSNKRLQADCLIRFSEKVQI